MANIEIQEQNQHHQQTITRRKGLLFNAGIILCPAFPGQRENEDG